MCVTSLVRGSFSLVLRAVYKTRNTHTNRSFVTGPVTSLIFLQCVARSMGWVFWRADVVMYLLRCCRSDATV